MNTDEKMPLADHLEELRRRLIICVIAIFVGFVASYFFKERLFEIIMGPLLKVMQEGDKLIFTGLTEAFFTYLKVAALSGVMLAAPVILYQFWMFVAPGLYQNEKRVMIPIVILSTFFFLGGSLFGYFIVFPFGFEFFLGFATDYIQPLPSMREYFSLASKLLLVFGLVFELPLVITFLARMNIVTIPFLKKNRKYAILLFFAGSAVITPPDVVTQVMMALPLMLLYEISILGARIFARRKKAEKQEAEGVEQ